MLASRGPGCGPIGFAVAAALLLATLAHAQGDGGGLACFDRAWVATVEDLDTPHQIAWIPSGGWAASRSSSMTRR